MSDIVEFLRARYAGEGHPYAVRLAMKSASDGEVRRALADVQAKLKIIEICAAILDGIEPPTTYLLADGVLQQLALPYADHPDYDPSWRPA